ncbi:MAG: hypothetical protein PVF53_18530, partial [Desulfobacterales bacterium]
PHSITEKFNKASEEGFIEYQLNQIILDKFGLIINPIFRNNKNIGNRILCLIGGTIDPYYKKRNFDLLFNRPKLLLSFSKPPSCENIRKKA